MLNEILSISMCWSFYLY